MGMNACIECSKHPNNGLRHSTRHLEAIEKEIPFYPIAKQAEYADAVTREHVNDKNFISDLLINGLPGVMLRGKNTTAFGNIAFIALNTKFKIASAYAKGLLDLYVKHYKKK